MIEALRRNMMANIGGGGPVLPPEYQQVEYLEATGTQYIRTSIIPKDGERLYAEVQFTGINGAYDTIFASGNSPSQNRLTYFYQDGYIYLRDNTGYTANRIGLYSTDKKIISRKVDGDKTKLLYLFSGDNGDNRSMSRYYIFTWYDTSDNVAHDFIPCYRKADNKPGLYDIVTGEFNINAGTGEFIVGADVN